MARTIRSPRTEVVELAAADIIALWRCAEAAATDSFADDGPNALTLTDTGDPGVGADQCTGVTTAGSRSFDGATQYGRTPNNTYADEFQGNCSAWAWLQTNATTDQAIISYGGSGSGGGVNNVCFLCELDGSDFLQVSWQSGANVARTATSDILITESERWFVGAAREVDPDNTGKVRVRFYAFNADSRLWYTDLVANLTDTDTTTTANFTIGVDGTLAAKFFDGNITDAGFAKVALHEWWFREQARHGVGGITYDQADMVDPDETSMSYASFARVRIEDSDRTWRDLTDLEPLGNDVVKSVSYTRKVENSRSTAVVTLQRAHHKANLAVEDRDSPINKDAAGSYSALLAGRRQARVEYALIPSLGRQPEEWEWEGLLEGWLDDPSISGEEITLTILDHATKLADMQIVEAAAYGDAAGTTVFDTTIQDLVDDNDTAYGNYLGHASANGPVIYFPAATGVTHNEFRADGMSVYEKINELVETVGFDCRMLYDDVRHEERITVYEPDRSTASVQWTWGPTEYATVDPWRQTTSAVRNHIRAYYGPVGSPDALGDPIRAYAEVIDTTSIAQYGYLYGEFNEGSGSMIDDATDAAAFVQAALDELSDPIAWFSVTRPFHPFVELADRIRFTVDGTPVRLFSTNTDVAVIGVTHTFDQTGRAWSSFEMRGLKASARGTRWNDRMVGGGRASAPVQTLTTPTTVAWQGAVGGGVVTWAYPAGRKDRVADLHEIHVGSTGFSIDETDPSTTLVGAVRGTSFPLFGYLDAESMPTHVRVVARDRFTNRSAGSTEVAIQAYYMAQVPAFKATVGAAGNNITNTPTKVSLDTEVFDVGANFDAATNFRFVAPREGYYEFTGQIVMTTAAQYVIAFIYVDGAAYGPQSTIDDLGAGFVVAPTVQVSSGPIYLDVASYVELFGQTDSLRAVQPGTYLSGVMVSEV